MKHIDPFPGTLTRDHSIKGWAFVLTDEQQAWLRMYFPCRPDKPLSKMMGCSYMSLRRIASKLGIKKDREVLRERYSAEMKSLVARERRKDRWGLPRSTNYKLCHKPYTEKEIRRRHNAVSKWGYVLADDCSEGSGNRYVIYYDQDTKRNKKFETYSKKNGFRIEEWSE